MRYTANVVKAHRVTQRGERITQMIECHHRCLGIGRR